MTDVRLSELVCWTDKQRLATVTADAHRYTLFGGARGPGKSYWLRWYALRFLLRCAARGLCGVRAMVACETFPALRDRQVEKLLREMPAWLGTWSESRFEYTLHRAYGGGVLCLRNLDDPDKYRSAEFALIAVDELTMDPESVFNVLRGSLRWPGIERTQFIAASNPNGPFAAWVRRYWIERQFPEALQPLANEFAFVPALSTDNPHLPPSYVEELNTLPDTLRRAWLHGDWYAGVEGLVYPEFGADNITDDEPDPNGELEVAFDDGYVDPRAILIIQRTGARILVCDELYHRSHLAETCVQELVDLCAARGWPRPVLAVGSPEAKELQARLRKADIPSRSLPHKIVDGIAVVRRLICDGQGYRAIHVNRRCKNLIEELTGGYMYPPGIHGHAEQPLDKNNHAADALRYWCVVRAR